MIEVNFYMQTNAPNVYTGIFNISGRRGADGQHVLEWSISLTFQEGGACANYREAFFRLASMVPLIDEGLNAGKSLGVSFRPSRMPETRVLMPSYPYRHCRLLSKMRGMRLERKPSRRSKRRPRLNRKRTSKWKKGL